MTEQQLRDARLKWLWQKHNAKRRGIEFDFPFEQWIDFWINSGHWNHRGIAKPDQYVMSRINDTGPYRLDNVVIKSNRDNVLEGNVGVKKPSNQVMFTCLHCRYSVNVNNRNRHWAGQRCRQKKAPRRMLFSLTD